MTIASITKDGTRTYPIDKMNFHKGSIETKDGNKRDGILAFFPGPTNYYGVYFTEDVKNPIEIFSFDDLKDARQEISEIEEFVGFGDFDVQKAPNANINGYLVNLKGEKKKGTIEMVDANDWWCRSIKFKNEEIIC